MTTKAVPFEIKSLDEQGVFTGYASVFGNVDEGGDVIVRGAFRKSLNDNHGDVPITWRHGDLIGKNLEAREDDRGLFVRGQINLQVQRGAEAYSLAKQGAVKGLSIEFLSIPDKTDRDAAGNRVLREVKWYGYALVPYPMNPEAVITDVKAQADHDEAVEMLRGAGRHLQNFYDKLIN